MKVTKENPESSFKPIKISIVIETKEEFDSIFIFSAHNVSLSESLISKSTWLTKRKYNADIAENFLRYLNDALEQ